MHKNYNIVYVGGQIIQDESNRHVQMHGPVMEGHSVVTNAGKLPCKKIIHAYGPIWRGGRQGEKDVLYDCVYKILEIAVEDNMSTIAIPSISSGAFRFPITESTSAIIEAIRDFLNKSTKNTLSEINLFDTKQDGARAFVTALKQKFQVTQTKSTGDLPGKKSTKKKGIVCSLNLSAGFSDIFPLLSVYFTHPIHH